jgi:hypothetical protein
MVRAEVMQQYPKTFQLTNGKPFRVRLMEPTEADRNAPISPTRKLSPNGFTTWRADRQLP